MASSHMSMKHETAPPYLAEKGLIQILYVPEV